jgi:hypothetical protein
MRVLTSSVLTFEIILIGLLIPTFLAFQLDNKSLLLSVSLAAILFAILAMARMKTELGLKLGWLVQILLFVLGGLVRPAFFMGVMWILAVIFTVLWVLAIRLGRKADLQKG